MQHDGTARALAKKKIQREGRGWKKSKKSVLLTDFYDRLLARLYIWRYRIVSPLRNCRPFHSTWIDDHTSPPTRGQHNNKKKHDANPSPTNPPKWF